MSRIVFKWFKLATLVLAIIPILIFLGFASAISLMDFNQYKPQIEAEVESLTGRDFQMNGNIDVSIIPFVFYFSEVALKNDERFSHPDLFAIEEVQIELSLLDFLVHKEIKILSLELIAPKLHLVKTELGDNWTDLAFLKLLQTPPAGKNGRLSATDWFETLERKQVSVKLDENSAVDETKQLSDGFYWAFDSLVVRDGEVSLVDEEQNYTERLSTINILTFDVVLGKPFNVVSDFIYDNSLSDKTHDFHLNGVLEIKDHFKQWSIIDWHGVFKLRLSAEKNVPEVRLTTSGEQFDMNLLTQKIAVKNARLHGLDANLTTSFSGNFGRNVSFEGEADVKNFHFKRWAYYLGISPPVFLEQELQGVGNGAFAWQWDGKLMQLNPTTLRVDATLLRDPLIPDEAEKATK